MSIWKTTSVADTPEIVLSQWRIVEVTSPYWDGASRHFTGYNETEREGRASSEIKEFDSSTMCGVTNSGRIYKLIGAPGYNGDGEYVWARWKAINHVETEKDVSEEVYASCTKEIKAS